MINALQITQENFESIVSKSASGILVLDGDGVIQYVNSAAEDLLQNNGQDLLGLLFGFSASVGQVTE